MRALVTVSLLGALLAGCSLSPERAQSELEDRPAVTLSDASAPTPTSVSVQLGKPLESELTEQSPVLIVDGTRGAFASFVVNLEEEGRLQVEVRSICNGLCFGISHTIMVPRLFAAAQGRAALELMPDEVRPQKPEWGYPASVRTIWKTPPLSSGQTTLLVVADGRKVGQVVGKAKGSGPPGIVLLSELPGLHNLKAFPYGKYILSVTSAVSSTGDTK
jgi:hypothetical protein